MLRSFSRVWLCFASRLSAANFEVASLPLSVEKLGKHYLSGKAVWRSLAESAVKAKLSKAQQVKLYVQKTMFNL